MERDALVDRLNDLIRATEDSHLALQKAAEDCTAPEPKTLFNDLAARRAAMVRDLQRIVATLGGAPDATGTLLGGARRMVAGIGAVLGTRDANTLLAEAIRGQQTVLDQYQGVLDLDGLPAPIQTDLTGHRERIREDRDRLAAAEPVPMETSVPRQSA